ncbi:MAG: hypothetical protein KBB32_09180 [Spirochaetia bacterium]|nr:hypothetical protein [Spirochaetia bacterium]
MSRVVSVVGIFMAICILSCSRDSERSVELTEEKVVSEKDGMMLSVENEKFIELLKRYTGGGKSIDIYYSDGSATFLLGGVMLDNGVPRCYQFGGSGMKDSFDNIRLTENELSVDILSMWVGAEETHPDERKRLLKFKASLTKENAFRQAEAGVTEMQVPAIKLWTLDLGPLGDSWDGKFDVREIIDRLFVEEDMRETIEVEIGLGEAAELINVSDSELEVNGRVQYLLKIRSGEISGWVPEEYIEFRE